MSAFVLDASVTLAWLLDDEEDERADAALNRLAEDSAIVPQLWHLEVRNALLVAERRGRIAANQLAERLEDLRRLPIQTDADTDLAAALSLAQTHGLSFYDAVYLELARRRNAALVSLDAELSRAAAGSSLPSRDAS